VINIPEGTQFIESGCGNKGFRKYEKGQWWFFEGFWRVVDWKMGDLTPVSSHPDYAAPIESWDGKGMPPVGTECEFTGHSPSEYDKTDPDLHVGDKVKIIAHFHVEGGFKMAAFLFNAQLHNKNRGPAYVEQGGAGCFRPIRTPEQIAAEEREQAIKQMISDTHILAGTMGNRQMMAEQLYDAGYRKQEAS